MFSFASTVLYVLNNCDICLFKELHVFKSTDVIGNVIVVWFGSITVYSIYDEFCTYMFRLSPVMTRTTEELIYLKVLYIWVFIMLFFQLPGNVYFFPWWIICPTIIEMGTPWRFICRMLLLLFIYHISVSFILTLSSNCACAE